MKTSVAATGIRHHQPIHSRDQIATASIGRKAKRVHTLHGFAWRIHLSPSSPKSLAIRRSPVAGGGLAGRWRARWQPGGGRAAGVVTGVLIVAS